MTHCSGAELGNERCQRPRPVAIRGPAAGGGRVCLGGCRVSGDWEAPRPPGSQGGLARCNGARAEQEGSQGATGEVAGVVQGQGEGQGGTPVFHGKQMSGYCQGSWRCLGRRSMGWFCCLASPICCGQNLVGCESHGSRVRLTWSRQIQLLDHALPTS